MAALCGDTACQPEFFKAVFTAGIERQLAVLEARPPRRFFLDFLWKFFCSEKVG
jgi:hypothetical protein